MSELSTATASALTNDQASALQHFQQRFGRVEISVSNCLFGAGLLFALVVSKQARDTGWLLWLGVAPILGAVVYEIGLLLVTGGRTGLTWHVLNAHPGMLARAAYSLLTLAWLIPLVKDEISPSSVGILVAGLIVLNVFLVSGVKSVSEHRAQVERERYSNHWLRLAQLSVWDILWLRIPYERA